MSLRHDTPNTLEALLSGFELKLPNTKLMGYGKSAEHTKEFQNILEHLNYTGSRRKNYRHYGPIGRIRAILTESCLYLTDGSNWNDRYDREHFNPDQSDDKRFGTCFSATTGESIAMWMLYGGIDGNGAMINFDKKTLYSATLHDEYECGFFKDDTFISIERIAASEIDFKLVDVLYFGDIAQDKKMTIQRVGDDKKTRITTEAFRFISPVAKHEAWKYENEVRLVATVRKLVLGAREPEITAIKVPFTHSKDFINSRVFNSPIADSSGMYRDSLLRGTVEWDLCSNCIVRNASG